VFQKIIVDIEKRKGLRSRSLLKSMTLNITIQNGIWPKHKKTRGHVSMVLPPRSSTVTIITEMGKGGKTNHDKPAEKQPRRMAKEMRTNKTYMLGEATPH
jgi:hypothetical protein